MNSFHLMNLLLGFLIGVYGTLVGAGGGFLLVPLFLLLYKMPHEIAVGTSIAIVAANACSGAIRYMTQKKVDYRMGVIFAIATFPGAFLGVYLTGYLSGSIFQKIFGCLLIAISLYLLLRNKNKTDHKKTPLIKWGMAHREIELGGKKISYSYSEPLGVFVSLFVGVLSSVLGIGGGILHVPMMTEWLNIPVHVATATSHFILAATALVGATMHARAGHLDINLAIWISVGAIFGAQIGALISDRVKGSQVLRYLSLAILFVGIRLLFS